MYTRVRAAWCFRLSLGLLVTACTGQIERAGAGGPSDPARTGGAGGTSGAADLIWPVRYKGAPSALRRLSRDEIIASMEQLTGLAPARDDLPVDPRLTKGALLTGGLSFLDSELGKLRLVIDDLTKKAAPAVL